MVRKPVSIYIHWPFCTSKCPYCDFNSHIKQSIDQNDWLIAIKTELNYLLENFLFESSYKYYLKSIFFGGGTPSLMEPFIVKGIINECERLFYCKELDKEIEITLEANPGSIFSDSLKRFFDAGVNRISIGVQSFDKNLLLFLGRDHSVYEAKKAIEASRNIFKNLSLDLMYALPKQSMEDWERSLNEAFQFDPDHLSLYQLTIEKGTAFYNRYKNGNLIPLKDDLATKMYYMTEEITKRNNMPAYEVSNYSKLDKNCIHNLSYWKSEDWIGIGPGATSRFFSGAKRMQINIRKDPNSWLKDVQNKQNGVSEVLEETAEDYMIEKVIMGLRLVNGINLDEVKKVLRMDRLRMLIENSFIIHKEKLIKTTFKGRLNLNTILAEIVK
ncbi:MAG: coproporphyrinogen III oxidase [SAR116 cluster bacterium]|nr:coproporphyrinogen III oxidase [SAR116 cluster bacterium]